MILVPDCYQFDSRTAVHSGEMKKQFGRKLKENTIFVLQQCRSNCSNNDLGHLIYDQYIFVAYMYISCVSLSTGNVSLGWK